MEFLCDRGADVNRGLRSSSLHYAACFGRPQIVKVTFIVILTVSVIESKIFTLVIFNGRFPDELDFTVCLLPQFQPSLC